MCAQAPAWTGHPLNGRVETAAGADDTLSVMSISPAGVQQSLAAEPVGASAAGKVNFTPDAAGRWQVTAKDSAGNFARVTMLVSAEPSITESADIPADVEGLRRIADATGGALIDNASATIRSRLAAVQTFDIKYPQPQWDTLWPIAALLGMCGVELVARRRANLL